MWQKLLSNIAGPLADVVVKGLRSAITSVVGSVADGMRTKKFNDLNEDLQAIRAELRVKPRISKDEAIDFARRLNDIGRKL